jgi:anhydro-N-acetylmuramic acid kinase
MAELYIGLISGTSMDGIDAVVVDFDQSPPLIEAAQTVPFRPAVRELLDQLRADPDAFPTARLARLDALLGDAFADAAQRVIQQAGRTPEEIQAIGSHGQTVAHHPEADPPWTLQIGDPHRIARQTGVTTVADFRRADMAAGGQGAPLAPLLHQALLGRPGEDRVVVNLGGIANLTWLPRSGGVSGFDTGPANCFLDVWYRRHHADRYDRNGEWASGGTIDQLWLEQLLNDPYFDHPPPKSTGIEYFSPDWLDRRLPDWAGQRPIDIQATLVELTAVSLARAMRQDRTDPPTRVILCGGGVHNRHLIKRIAAQLPGTVIESSDRHGLDPDLVEAMLFAWLARERLAGRPIHTCEITGASTPIHSGVVFVD